jgi:hypothetical protein
MLKMTVYCATHDDATVIPAGDEFHFKPQSVTKADTGRTYVEFELDAADLYCTAAIPEGEFPEHQFIVSVFADETANFAGNHVDGMGCDIIA